MLPIQSQLTDNFRVTKDNNIFKKNRYLKRFLKVCRVSANIFSVIAFPVGITRYCVNNLARSCILPAVDFWNPVINRDKVQVIEFFYLEKNEFIRKKSNHAHQIKVTTADGVELDTLMIRNKNQLKTPRADQKWIVFFNTNGNCYELLLDYLKEISDRIGVNVYTGNYRGVMGSKGKPNSTHDLVLDGEAMVQKLLIAGVSPENILLHGWSFGGGVATEVAAYHQEAGHEMNVCNDRSFASLIHASASIIPTFGRGLGRIAWLSGWKFNSVNTFKKINEGHKFIIVGENDNVISPQASLHQILKRTHPQHATPTITLSGPDIHNSLLTESDNIMNMYIDQVKLILKMV